MKKKIVTALVALGVLIILIALVVTLTKPSKDVVATVNGEAITKEEFTMLYDKVVAFDPAVSKEMIIDQLVSNKVLLQEAKKSGLSVEDKEVDGVISLTEALYGKKISELLANASIPIDMFRSKIKEQLLMSKLLNQSIKVDEPTEEDLRSAYKNNTQYFVVPAMVNVSHILTKTEEEAKKIKEELDSGADFYTLASENSIDPSAKMNAGNLGPMPRGATVPEFEEAAFSLPVGTLSDPVKSQFGYHVIKVEGKTEEKKLGFSEVKDQVKSMLTQQKQQEVIKSFVDSLLKKAKVKKYLENA